MNDKTDTIKIYTITKLTEAGLKELLDKVKAEKLSFAIWERVDDVRFPEAGEQLYTLDTFKALSKESQQQLREKSVAPLILAEWKQGRIFNDKLEIRWQRNENSYRTWITVEVDDITPEAAWGEPAIDHWLAEKNHTIYLWGEHDPRIGRQMNYEAIGPPAGPDDRAQVVLTTYHDPQTYKMRHYRYVRMQREVRSGRKAKQ